MKKEMNFDFQSPIKNLAQKAEKQSYKHLLFFAISLSVLAPLSYKLIDSIGNSLYNHHEKALQNAIFKKNTKLAVIKNMNQQQFQSFIDYLSLNLNNYDNQVDVLNKSIQQAYILNSKHSLDIGTAITDQQTLEAFKDNLKSNILNIIKTKRNVDHQLPVQEKEVQLFLKYLSYYQSYLPITSDSVEDMIQTNLNTNWPENIQYNNKNNIFHQIKVLNQELNQKFLPKKTTDTNTANNNQNNNQNLPSKKPHI
jgi:hypothetical protein